MNIVYVNYEDVIGRRFNGFELCEYLHHTGHKGDLFVCEKSSDRNSVHAVWSGSAKRIKDWCSQVEKRFSLQNIFFPPALIWRKAARNADIIHLNLISGSYIAWWEFLLLSKLKPVILSLHDNSPLTGYCVHPANECRAWMTGCKNCPDLHGIFSLQKDNAAFLWHYKKLVWNMIRPTIIVASKTMLQAAERSPMFYRCNKHLLPFACDLEIFRPASDVAAIRKKFDIPATHKVVSFRALDSPYKGLDTIRRALTNLDASMPLSIITLNGPGLFDEFKDKFNFIELSWINKQNSIAEILQASDLFLMPSTKESFGMMAMEAMACGVPAIVCEETPMVDTLGVPEAGLSIPKNDGDALAAAMKLLLENDSLREKMGKNGRQRSMQNHDQRKYQARMVEIYTETLEYHHRG